MSRGPYKKMVRAIPVDRCTQWQRSFYVDGVYVSLPDIEDGHAKGWDGRGCSGRVKRRVNYEETAGC